MQKQPENPSTRTSEKSPPDFKVPNRHLVLATTRYASIEPSSLDAAIKDGLGEVLPWGANTKPPPAHFFVYCRNRHNSTVTIDIAISAKEADGANAVRGSIQRRQNAHCLVKTPAPGPNGLTAVLDEAAAELGLQNREALGDFWQIFDLPFDGFDATAPVFFGHPRKRRTIS